MLLLDKTLLEFARRLAAGSHYPHSRVYSGGILLRGNNCLSQAIIPSNLVPAERHFVSSTLTFEVRM